MNLVAAVLLDGFLSARTISVLEMESAQMPHAYWSGGEAKERGKQADFLRDIFGNPFRPVSLAPAWMTPAVLNLAQAAYDNRPLPSGLLDNAGLAILADALEEAGCADPEILSHLRGPGPHVRGCWLRFVDGQYDQPLVDGSSRRGQAEPGRQLMSRADAISAEGGSLLKHDPTRRGLTTPAEGVQGVKRRTRGTRPRYPV